LGFAATEGSRGAPRRIVTKRSGGPARPIGKKENKRDEKHPPGKTMKNLKRGQRFAGKKSDNRISRTENHPRPTMKTAMTLYDIDEKSRTRNGEHEKKGTYLMIANWGARGTGSKQIIHT